ncbi:MAG TPA: hypothetical protein VFS00_08200, partial [Polyangiaceae bacterium]|nr:hypothetical protein [Polyangiaceae bacterium]
MSRPARRLAPRLAPAWLAFVAAALACGRNDAGPGAGGAAPAAASPSSLASPAAGSVTGAAGAPAAGGS